MMKVLILAAGTAGSYDPKEVNPTVLYFGSDEQIALVKTALDSALDSATGAASAPSDRLATLVVVVDDTVTVGDTLETESLVFKKHN